MNFSTTIDNGIPHVLDYPWQFIRTDMRVGIGKNGLRCSMLAEYI